MMMQQKQICRKKMNFNVKKRILWRISVLRRYVRSIWSRFVSCWRSKTSLKQRAAVSYSSSSSPPPANVVSLPCCCLDQTRDSSDLVPLKISLFGDSNIGKTSFLTKYAGEKNVGEEELGINHVDKTLYVKGARISYSIWEVRGDDNSSLEHIHISTASKDSVAMLFMFDLTSRCTLNSVIRWYQEARKCNQNAIPVIIGTKFDEFMQLPIDLQWTIASQARAYAKALNATLFFSSANYNINVNKIFKFITAKLFNLNWNMERNLTIGEPIIDF